MSVSNFYCVVVSFVVQQVGVVVDENCKYVLYCSVSKHSICSQYSWHVCVNFMLRDPGILVSDYIKVFLLFQVVHMYSYI